MEHHDAIYVGNTIRKPSGRPAEGAFVDLLGESYYRIRNYDRLAPFFMSIVSSTDHWLFVSSTGGLSAGRVNADSALFPYYTDDKLTENAENTGPKTILLVERGARTYLWEPFSSCTAGVYRTERNLYKNLYGDKLLFEEINVDLELVFRYGWRTSDRYGFVRTSWLANTSAEACAVSLLDGLQNLLPYGTTAVLQANLSNLLDAYKRNELDPHTGLGIFALSSTLTDLAEPSESLKATTVWQAGLDEPCYLLSSAQLEVFRCGREVEQEVDVRGRRGAFFVRADLALAPAEERSWMLVAEVDQDSTRLASLRGALRRGRTKLGERVAHDVDRGKQELIAIIAGADGLQMTSDPAASAHHLACVLFNIMRGGTFVDGFTVDRSDLLDFLRIRNSRLTTRFQGLFDRFPPRFLQPDLVAQASKSGSADLERLAYHYLPLAFSRRHGDPSRPWNRFSINLKHPDGSKRLDYQGNWRDIFQNWEPLAYAYPEFAEAMIVTFLSATTADGYNPYRLTRDGVEWEVPEPDDPWANIGYWSDHQIIYLQKLMEASARLHPGRLADLLERRIFSHVEVPYRIKRYQELLVDPYDTIIFDQVLDREIGSRVATMGGDGKLLLDAEGDVFHVTLAEKLLVLLLAKLANFVPEGGIWMNTQRPEWNDANNALVGKGMSVVTTGYLRRYVVFLRELFAACDGVEITQEVARFLEGVGVVLDAHRDGLDSSFGNAERRDVLDALGPVSSDYRWHVYQSGFSGAFTRLGRDALLSFLDLVQSHLEHTLRVNSRSDGLYHAYNLLHLEGGAASVGQLDEMLEGQVAILSSGLLSGPQSLALLHGLRHSRLYRSDQHSYLLYPDRTLPGFLSKNCLSEEQVGGLALVAALVERGDTTLITRDEDGVYHFDGALRNAKDVKRALDALERSESAYAEFVRDERSTILDLYEEIFEHASFTGRSGTFFAYEGLGSIYWHMVSKLLLAVQETYFLALGSGESTPVLAGLAEAYFDIRRGIGFNKTPQEYGAFPTDPYSHTPAGGGAKQPGMTGQAKEDILIRMGELGIVIDGGCLQFTPRLLRRNEFLRRPTTFQVHGLDGPLDVALEPGTLAFTVCQVPVVYHLAERAGVRVTRADGTTTAFEGTSLDVATSRELFGRTATIDRLDVQVDEAALVADPSPVPASEGG